MASVSIPWARGAEESDMRGDRVCRAVAGRVGRPATDQDRNPSFDITAASAARPRRFTNTGVAFRGSVRLVAAFVCLAGLRAGPVFGQDCNGNGIADGNELFGAMTLASVDSSGAAGTDSSFDVTLSADARYVAFYSLADDLVPDDGNGQTDVFRVDRWTRVVTRLPNSDRGFATIDMTPDGRFIGYVRETDYMGSSTPQLWLYDHETGASELVSVDGTGAPGDSWSLSPVMSADGRYVAFWSMASNLIPDDTNGKADVFRRDRLTGGIIRVSVGAAGEEGDGA